MSLSLKVAPNMLLRANPVVLTGQRCGRWTT
jgi:hypothetical protein